MLRIRSAFLVGLLSLLFGPAALSESVPGFALDCPCSLETISDSGVQVEVGVHLIARDVEYDSLELEVLFTPYRDTSLGWILARADITESIDEAIEGRLTTQMLLQNLIGIPGQGYLYLRLLQDDLLADVNLLSSSKVSLPQGSKSLSDGFFLTAYPEIEVDSERSLATVGNIQLKKEGKPFSGEVTYRFLYCPSHPASYLEIADKCAASEDFGGGGVVNLSVTSVEAATVQIDEVIDFSNVPLKFLPERLDDLWISFDFGDTELLQALGRVKGSGYQNYKIDVASPDVFADSNNNELSDVLEDLLRVSGQSLEDPLDLLFLYGSSISDELGQQLETKIDYVVALAQRLMFEAGVPANLRVVGLLNMGQDDGLLNREIFERLGSDPAWRDNIREAGVSFDFMIYVHNDVEDDTTDGLASVNGSSKGGLLSSGNRISSRSNFAVVDIDSGARDSTLAHELGHLLGLGHSRRQIYVDRDSSPGTFPWAVGYGEDSSFSTVMASVSTFDSSRIEVFSNPDLQCSSSPCGVEFTDVLNGADSSRALKLTYPQALKISEGSIPYLHHRLMPDFRLPQGNNWDLPEVYAEDYEDGDLSLSVVTDLPDLEVVGQQQIVFSVEDSDGNGETITLPVTIVSDRDRDGVSDAEELAVGTSINDQDDCYDCYVFDSGSRIGLRGTMGDDLLFVREDGVGIDGLTMYGLGGADTILGGEKGDTLFGESGDDTLFGQGGSDQIFGGSGNDSVLAGEGDDQIFGGSGEDLLYGDIGNDQVFGGSDDDSIYGGPGDDQLFGGSGNDKLYGDEGSDQIFGGSGEDFMRGGEGDDLLSGGSGFNYLYGGDGNDKLVADAGGGFLVGEGGADVLFVGSESGSGGDDIYVRGFSEEDSLALGIAIRSVFTGVFQNTGNEFLAIELQNEARIFIYEPFFENLNLNWVICSSDTSLDDYSGLRGGGSTCDVDGDGIPDSSDAFPVDPSRSADTDGDGIDNTADDDDDGDGVSDSVDAFPLDATETSDNDLDGIGDNADTDDDNDGFSDLEEIADGTDPLSRFSCRSGCFSFDVDDSAEAKALSDGLLVIRHLFGFTGDALVAGAVADGATRNDAEEISALLSAVETELDIDGNGEAKALSDGLLLIRYLFGFSGDALTNGAIGEGATRQDAEEIESYISARVPSR